MFLARRGFAFVSGSLGAVVALAAVLALSGCGADDGSGRADPADGYLLKQATDLPRQVEAIRKRGRIRVGVKVDQPGFGYRSSSGVMSGFDVEMARLVAVRIFGDASKVTFVETRSAVREQVLRDRRVDVVIATYTVTSARRQQVAFAGPYFRAGQDLAVRAADRTITGPAALAGRRVCSQTGSTSLARIRETAPRAVVTALGSYAECAQGVRQGRFDAVTTDNVVLAGLVAASGDELRLVGRPFSDEPYGMAVNHGDRVLRQFLSDTLDAILLTADWHRAWARTLYPFLGTSPTPPELAKNW